MFEFTPAQEQAINSLSANVAVSAGAGAGKTRVLVERYINILRHRQATCAEILAITFTNKAAKEMKERIRAKAAELAESATNEEDCRLWLGAKAELEYAPIGTFHSFCASLLRDNPVEAAIDPRFAVLDEMEATILLETSLSQVMEDALAEEAEWLDRLLTAYDKKMLDAEMPGLYDKLASQGLLCDDLALRLAEPYQQSLADENDHKEKLKQLCDELISCKGTMNSKTKQYALVERLERDHEIITAAIGALGTNDEAAYIVVNEYLGGLGGNSKVKEIVVAIKAQLAVLELLRADRLALALIPDLCQLLLLLDAALDAQKVEQRVLTFSDLEVRTARLLKDCPAVRRKCGQRFRQIMVDEFQDTNELQRQIVYILAGGDADNLRGDKLFIVGDAKQSIYRFRGADVTLFDRVRRDIAATGGSAVELADNFRSMDGLLALYNGCFSAIMGTTGDTIAFSPLQARRCGRLAENTRAELMVIAPGDWPPEQTAREAEAARVAERIRMMVEGCEELIDHDATPRAVKYGDIAILFRSAKDSETYAAALQRLGVPYYLVGGQGFYSCQEIRDVLNLLAVVDNRYQETALAGVLRSPLFRLDDMTLLRLKECAKEVAKESGGSLWQGLASFAAADLSEEQCEATARAWKILNKMWGLRGIVRVAELIELALEETGYANFLLTQFMGQQKYANLSKLTALARNFESKGFLTPGEFLRYVTKLVDGEIKEGQAIIENEGGDTVKLMTIHKAKGLEYPVVFVPDLHRKFRNETAPVLFNPADGLGLKVPVNGSLTPTSVYDRIAAAEKQLALLELKRVLYVALTRAKDYLVLSGATDKITVNDEFGAINSWFGWLGWVCGLENLTDLPEELTVNQAEILISRMPATETPDKSSPPGTCPVCQPPSLTDRERLLANIGPVAKTVQNGRFVFSASKIDRFLQCPRAFYYNFVEHLPPVAASGDTRGSGGPPAHLTGTALHRCLEIMDEGLYWQQVLEQATLDTVPARWRAAVTKDAEPLLRRYLASRFYREIAALPARKEWSFNFRLPEEGGDHSGYHFNGKVDRVVDYGSAGLGIIDYKTDNVSSGQVLEKAREHELQLQFYAIVVEAILHKPVKEAKLYFLRSDTTVDVPVNQEAKLAAVAGTLPICRYIDSHSREAEYECKLHSCDHCDYRVFCPRC